MAYRVKAYTLREESTESGTRYFISFKDGQGKSHELEVSGTVLYGVSADGTQEQGISSNGTSGTGVFGSMGRNAEQAGVEAALRALRNK